MKWEHGVAMTVSEEINDENIVSGEVATQGGFNGFTISSLMQMIETDLRSCSVQVHGEGLQRGTLIFEKGDPLDASCGRLTGDEAVLEMIGWDTVSIVFLRMPEELPAKTVFSSTMGLIMEGMRLMDERVAEQEDVVAEAEVKVPVPEPQKTSSVAVEPKSSQENLSVTLKNIADEMDGSIAVAVVGMDGITVAVHNPTGEDMDALSAKFAMVMKLIERSVEDMDDLGEMEENLVQTDSAWILTRFLTKQYYLAFIVSRNGILGNVRLVAKKYLQQVQEQL